MDKLTRSYVHRGGETRLLGCTVDEGFLATVTRFPEREAAVSVHQGLRYCYQELEQQVESVTRGLLGLGAEKGDSVGVWSTNNMEWLLLQLATARIGAVLVNINPSYRKEELAYALVQAKVKILLLMPGFRDANYAAMLMDICPELREKKANEFSSESFPDLRRVVIYDPLSRVVERPAFGFLLWEEFLATGESIQVEMSRERREFLDPDDAINIQFTSGTTGHPKAVVLTHHGLVNNAYFIGEIMRLTEQDRLCVPVPFYHCFGMVVSNLACLLRGAAIVMPAAYFQAEAMLQGMQQEHCTAMNGVPTMFIAVLEALAHQGKRWTGLRTGIMAGAPCPPEIMRRVIDEMGCRDILIAYGQTEASPVTHMTRPDDTFDRRVNTVGTNLPHQEVKVVDTEQGRIVPIGVPGEVCFRGYHVMRGYFGNEEATRKTIDEQGWLHSGDIGVMDEDGYLQITGRIKDMIIRGGENIYPAEIEAVYYQHPSVAEVAVFGVPDSYMGEEVGAWIKLEEGTTASEEDMRQYIREHLARYKIPRYIWFVEEFPMTVTGKIQKFKIRETVADWMKSSPTDAHKKV